MPCSRTSGRARAPLISQVGPTALTLIESRIVHFSLHSTDRSRASLYITSGGVAHEWVCDEHSDLHRRGCVRTAFEFARLLYSLDPWTDPHGALLHLDYIAIKMIKSGMGQWLLDIWDYFNEWPPNQLRNRVNVSVLPGWAYARALALRAREDSEKDRASIPGIAGFGLWH